MNPFGPDLTSDRTCLAVTTVPDIYIKEKTDFLAIVLSQSPIGVIGDVTDHDHLQRCVFRKLPPILKFFGFVRDWIRECVEQHGEECTPSAEASAWPQQLRLITCANRQIVEAPSRVRYAALSYVWGSKTYQERPQNIHNPLSETVPQVIEDAIRVAQSCGIDFLWVDRYCIDQANAADVHRQVRQMDRIYQAAFITLIDAAGRTSCQGLSGVSRLLRNPQNIVQVGLKELADAGEQPHDEVDDSPWITRAWIYQEDFFSHKRLFFTPRQLYWVCQQRRHCEIAPITTFFLRPPHKSLTTPSSSDVLTLLQKYTGGELTYQSDAIRAFEGVFRFFERVGVFHYLGIPILPETSYKHTNDGNALRSQSDRFADGLCWIAVGPGKRRHLFPSWSWAGWQHEIHFPDLPDYSGPSNMEEASVKILREDSRGSLISFDDYPLSSLFPSWTNIIGSFIWIETLIIPIRAETLPEGLEFEPTIEDPHLFVRHCGLFAVFEDTNRGLYAGLYSNEYAYPYEKQSDFSELQERWSGDEVLGILLPAYYAFIRNPERLFVLLVQHKGDHYQRIGHMTLSPEAICSITENADTTFQPKSLRQSKKSVSWGLCFRNMSFRSLRLG